MADVVCVSDLHENLVPISKCDLLIVAGDVSYAPKNDLEAKHRFLDGPFRDWLDRVPAEEIVLVAGNHVEDHEVVVERATAAYCAGTSLNASTQCRTAVAGATSL